MRRRSTSGLLLLLLGTATVHAAAPRELDTMAQRMRACVGCHDSEDRASGAGYLPRIAGKQAGYLYNQLVNFRDGRRRSAAMEHLLATMSDAYLEEIATYFATLELPYPPPGTTPSSTALMARGELLVKRGDAGLRVPACIECHGERLTGRLPATPGLLGLSRDYLIAQLGAWRHGHRVAMAPDCMAQVARRLDGGDIAAVASWLASRAVPDAGAAPASADGALPLECGSAAQ